MNEIFNVAIIGGGASGLLCATELVSGDNALSGNGVIVLERLDRVGKKLIATGNGQGNLSNANLSKEYYHGDGAFIDGFINTAKALSLQDYFYNLGVPFITVDDGRQYPLSKQASAVLDIIRANLKVKGVTEKVDFCVTRITHCNGLFVIRSKDQIVLAKKVVLAVGGKAGSQFGTDGSSYALAQNFGHSVTDLYPSLVQLKTEQDLVRGLKGLKEQVVASAYDGEKKLASCVGEVLFTDYGVSGNAIFKISGAFASVKKPILNLEFLPSLTLVQTEGLLADRIKNVNYIDKKDLLCAILNKRVGQAVLKTAKSLSPKDLAYAIKNFRLKVTGNTGFKNAQVTKGGIRTNEIDIETYESKFQRGLYLAGELLDVDGDCGGYNLTFAFVSGITIARAIKNKWSGNYGKI